MSPRIGRPTLPDALRKEVRVTLRLDASDEVLLAELTAKLGTTESEVLRHALRSFHLPEAS